jgi:hypothetical protein
MDFWNWKNYKKEQWRQLISESQHIKKLITDNWILRLSKLEIPDSYIASLTLSKTTTTSLSFEKW